MPEKRCKILNGGNAPSSQCSSALERDPPATARDPEKPLIRPAASHFPARSTSSGLHRGDPACPYGPAGQGRVPGTPPRTELPDAARLIFSYFLPLPSAPDAPEASRRARPSSSTSAASTRRTPSPPRRHRRPPSRKGPITVFWAIIPPISATCCTRRPSVNPKITPPGPPPRNGRLSASGPPDPDGIRAREGPGGLNQEKRCPFFQSSQSPPAFQRFLSRPS
jgi:hypothetical protein